MNSKPKGNKQRATKLNELKRKIVASKENLSHRVEEALSDEDAIESMKTKVIKMKAMQ